LKSKFGQPSQDLKSYLRDNREIDFDGEELTFEGTIGPKKERLFLVNPTKLIWFI